MSLLGREAPTHIQAAGVGWGKTGAPRHPRDLPSRGWGLTPMDAAGGGGGCFPLSWVIRNLRKAQPQTACSLLASKALTWPGGHLHWNKAWGSGLGEVGRKRTPRGPATGPRITCPFPGLPLLPEGMVEAQEPQGPQVWTHLGPKSQVPAPTAWIPGSPLARPGPTSSTSISALTLPVCLDLSTISLPLRDLGFLPRDGRDAERKETGGLDESLRCSSGSSPRGLHGDLPSLLSRPLPGQGLAH